MDAPRESRSSLHTSCDWQRFLETQGDVFFLFARQQTRTEADAKDLTQLVLTEVWQKTGGIIPDKALVFSMLRRRAIDVGRSKDRRSRREMDFFETDESWFLPNFGERDAVAHVEQALKGLSKDLREVVVLRIWGDLTFPEIAQMTGVSVPTATSRFRYGIDHLRKSEIIAELRP